MPTDRDSLLLRGVLDLCVMALIASSPLYGYEIASRLAERGITVASGSIYPLLARLEKSRLIEAETHPSEIGPPRRWWRLTAEGSRTLQQGRADWQRISTAVSATLTVPATTTTTTAKERNQ